MLTQVMANNHIYFDTLAKYSPVNSKEYKGLHSVLLQEFENITSKFSNGMQRVAIRYPTQKFINVSLSDFYKLSLSGEKKYPLLHSRILFMSSLLAVCTSVSNHCYR